MINLNEYYDNPRILQKILNYIRYRESVLLRTDGKYPMRCIFPGSTSSLNAHLKRFNVIDEKYNLYSSVARYNFKVLQEDHKILPVSFKLKDRKPKINLFSSICDDYILKYDFVLDFDVIDDNYDKTYNDVLKTVNFFDVLNAVYSLRFSGRGFHIVVDHKYLPDRLDEINLCKNLANTLKKLINLSTLDLTIYDSRRVIKTPFSFDNKSGLVCVPINKIGLENFNKDFANINYVLNNINKFDEPIIRKSYDANWLIKLCNEVNL